MGTALSDSYTHLPLRLISCFFGNKNHEDDDDNVVAVVVVVVVVVVGVVVVVVVVVGLEHFWSQYLF